MKVYFTEQGDEGGGQYGASYNSNEAGQVYDDNYEIQQYHQDIRNHYAQQNLSTQQAYSQPQTTDTVTSSGSSPYPWFTM